MKKLTPLLLSALFLSAPLAACGGQEQPAAETTAPMAGASIPAAEPSEPTTVQSPNESEEKNTNHSEQPAEVPEPEPEPTPRRASYILVKQDGVNLRTGAGTNFRSVGKSEKGTLLKCVKRVGDWYETRYLNARAYISANGAYTSPFELDCADDATERIIEEGLSLLGTPYVYGATRLHDGTGRKLDGFTTGKFDCSSLMQYIFYEGAGVLLNMNTRTQVSQGRAATGELTRGDLLFFTNASRRYNTGLERVGHVALYLGGNYILHTASDVAKIEQISQTRWSYFICARRML